MNATKKKNPLYRRMRWETWVREFKPLVDSNGDPARFETFGADLARIRKEVEFNPLKVWTEVENDTGTCLCIIEGCHLVNRQAYFVTQVEYDPKVQYRISL